jgi:hypothetical protein
MVEEYRQSRVQGIGMGSLLLLCVVAVPPLLQSAAADPDSRARGIGWIRLWYDLPGQPWLGHAAIVLTVLFALMLLYKSFFGSPMLRLDDEGLTQWTLTGPHLIPWRAVDDVQLVEVGSGLSREPLMRVCWTDWTSGQELREDISLSWLAMPKREHVGLVERVARMAREHRQPANPYIPAAFSGGTRPPGRGPVGFGRRLS